MTHKENVDLLLKKFLSGNRADIFSSLPFLQRQNWKALQFF